MKAGAPQHDPDAPARARDALLDAHRRGERRELEAHWAASGPGATVEDLAALVKLDMQCRAERGERPTVQDYAGRFPALAGHKDRMVSLIYEEYCLAEERGEEARASEFCRRYAPWADSLAWQLDCHANISRFAPAPGPAPRFPQIDERFGGFRLRSVLGQGGAARVYLATDEELGHREVALKISADRGDEPSIQGRLDHAHIVPVLSVVHRAEGDLRGLCMPYREGMTLDRVLDRVRPGAGGRRRAADLPGALVEPGEPPVRWPGFPDRGTYAQGVAWVIGKVAEALAHAHARQIHHRDVKPANVLLTRLNGPQLLDFNLAHDRDAAEEARAALRGGTLPYMAPEQVVALGDPALWSGVGPRADLFSLGLLAAELLTGRRPRSPDPALPLPAMLGELLALRGQGQSPLSGPGKPIPHALRAILERCLRADPAERYPDAEALAEDLRRFVERRPLKTARNPSAREVAGNWARRNRPVVAAALVVALLFAAGPTLWRWFQGPNAAAYYVTIGSERVDRGELDLAERAYRSAVSLDPTNSAAHAGLGCVAARRNRLDDALAAYDRAILLAKGPDGANSDILIGRAFAHLLKGKSLLNANQPGWIDHYRDCRRDLAAAQRRGIRAGDRKMFDVLLADCDLGLGDFAAGSAPEESLRIFREAAQRINDALRRFPNNSDLILRSKMLNERLEKLRKIAPAPKGGPQQVETGGAG